MDKGKTSDELRHTRHLMKPKRGVTANADGRYTNSATGGVQTRRGGSDTLQAPGARER